MSTRLKEISCAIKQTFMNIKTNTYGFDIIDPIDIMKYATRNYTKVQVKPKILCINVNKLSGAKFQEIIERINATQPDVAWFMENWTEFPEILGYNRFIDKSIYRNTLLVKSELIRNRLVTEIPYGFRLEDLYFRYIPPHSKRCELTINEFGDYNFLSNSWIDITNFTTEIRQNKIGGMGFKTNIENNYRFIEFPSDHSAIFVQFKSHWDKYLRNDYYKLENEILSMKQNKSIGYIFKNSDNYNYPKNKSNKLINPIKENLDLSPWYDLYKHKEDKINVGYKPVISNGKLHNINSRAYDANNISNKMVIDILNKYNNTELIQQFINNNNRDAFESKVVCLRKKDKEANSILNLRAIQISPVNFKLAEQSRTKLKEWLIAKSDKRIFSFVPNSSCCELFKNLKDNIEFLGRRPKFK